MTTAELFGSASVPADTDVPESGLLVTNHLNLMYMLAAGLVMPPVGFGDKYFHDTLGEFPGWIPLFIDKVPGEAIESSIREAAHLKPIVVEYRLAGISGPAMAIGEQGVKDIRLPGSVDRTAQVLLLPAPLPTSRIVSVVFHSSDHKRACEAEAREYGNVSLEDYRRRTSKPLFAKATNAPWPSGKGPEERSVPLQAPFAVGGVMAMLCLFANLGERAVGACRIAFDPESGIPSTPGEHPILASLGSWIRDGKIRLPAVAIPDTNRIDLQNRSQAMLFWNSVQRMVDWRAAGEANSVENVLIEHLAAATTDLDPRLRAGVSKLHDTLVSLTGLGDATASELFERHDTPLAHAMILFFLRRDCADLLDYQSDRLTEPDWLAAAILFGVRDGWLKLPLRLREGRALADAVSHRMARLSHQIAQSGLDLGEAPPRIRPLRELFGDGAGWRVAEKRAALEIARAQRWDCISTRINLGPGEYKLIVRGGSTQIELPGEPGIRPEIDASRFLELLARSRLDHKLEAEIRKTLKS